jgi:hypothetical protein
MESTQPARAREVKNRERGGRGGGQGIDSTGSKFPKPIDIWHRNYYAK